MSSTAVALNHPQSTSESAVESAAEDSNSSSSSSTARLTRSSSVPPVPRSPIPLSPSSSNHSTFAFVRELVNEVMMQAGTATLQQQSSVDASQLVALTGGVAGPSSSATHHHVASGSNSGSSYASTSTLSLTPPPTSATTSVIYVPIKRNIDQVNAATGSGKECSSKSGCKKTKCKHTDRVLSAAAAQEEAVAKQKLEQRLNSILCCAVCLDLPKSTVYQCTNGHLMCAGCFTHLLADARIRDETATCPNCRCVISKDSCSRNLAVEKAVCELPAECRFCNRELPRSLLDKHTADICEERIVACRYASIGCPWKGPFHENEFHGTSCQHPSKSGKDVMCYLTTQEKTNKEEKKTFDSLFNLLSYEKITLNDLQFRPYRTDEYIHKLFYETNRFLAFNLQWVVKARVNDDQRDPTQSIERQLSYQIALKSKISAPLTMHFMIMKGPFGDMKVVPKIYKHDFSESSTESAFNRIVLNSSAECNRLLAAKVIHFRVIMFQAPTK